MKKSNVAIDTVFSNVSRSVSDKSRGVQTPMYTGTGVSFEMMNEKVASWNIKKYKEQLEKLKAEEKTAASEDKKQYATEEKMLAVKIKIQEDQKNRSKKDAAEKEKAQKEADERNRKLAKENEEIKKAAEQLKKQAVIIGVFFGGFQALMPLIGWVLGKQFERYITNVDHWIAFVLLGFIGGKMIVEALKSEEEKKIEKDD